MISMGPWMWIPARRHGFHDSHWSLVTPGSTWVLFRLSDRPSQTAVKRTSKENTCHRTWATLTRRLHLIS